MKSARLIKKGLGLLILAVFLGCAPRATPWTSQAGDEDFGPRREDTDLTAKLAASPGRKIEWKGVSDLSTLDQVIEDLDSIERAHPARGAAVPLRALSAASAAKNYGQESMLSEGSYFRLLVRQKKSSSIAELKRLRDEAVASVARIKSELPKYIPLEFKKGTTFVGMVSESLGQLQKFDTWLASERLSPLVVSALKLEISRRHRDWRPDIDLYSDFLDREPGLVRFINAVEDFMSKRQIPVSKELQADLDWAHALGTRADTMKTERDALGLFVYMWRTLPKNEREATFNKINADLAGLFKSSEERDLECFAGGKCDPQMEGHRDEMVLPEIKTFGVEKIRELLNQECVKAAREKVFAVINKALPSAAPLIIEVIDRKFAQAIAIIDAMINRFDATLKARMDQSGLKEVSLTPHRFSVTSGRNSEISLQWQNPQAKTMVVKSTQAAALAPMLAQGAVSRARGESMWLAIVSDAAGEYEAPSELVEATASSSFSARDFARVVSGHARFLQNLRDRKVHAVVSRLLDFSAQDLFPEYEAEFLKELKFFPPNVLSSLVLSRVAKMLELISQAGSPVFILGLDRKLVWADDLEAVSRETFVHSGIVDKSAGTRRTRVRAEDVARLTLALTEFLKASEGIETDIREFTDVDELKKGREKIRLLTLATASYLSHSFRREDGLIGSEVDLATQEQVGGDAALVDQALAIKALASASEVLKVKIFAWEAVDTLFAMNKELFSSQLGFYSARLKRVAAPELPIVLETMDALTALRAVLPETSRSQVDRILEPWLASLGAAKIAVR